MERNAFERWILKRVHKHVTNKHRRKAMQILNFWLFIFSRNEVFLKVRGEIELMEYNFGNTLRDYEMIKIINPQNADIIAQIGNIYLYKIDEPKKALNYYRQAIKIDKHNADSWSGLGYIYYDSKHYQRAVRCYTNAIRIYPKERRYYLMRALAYKQLNQVNAMNSDMAHIERITNDEKIEADYAMQRREVFRLIFGGKI